MQALLMRDGPIASLGLSEDASAGPLEVRRLAVRLESDDRRVITRPFMMGVSRVRSLFDRLALLSESQVQYLLRDVDRHYNHRHDHLPATFREHYELGASMIDFKPDWTPPRRLLAGAYLTMEYSIDSAALFNPSIVPHHDQAGVPRGSVRFIMSLRATGEGHVSSIVFRTGTISRDNHVQIDPIPERLHRARMAPDRVYVKHMMRRKMQELGANGQMVDKALEIIPDRCTLAQISNAVENVRKNQKLDPKHEESLQTLLWMAQSNYHVDLDPNAKLSELVIFPMSAVESNGMEDLRLTRFVEDDGSTKFYGTYTAYNGVRTLPMLLHTSDFGRIEFASLNGRCAQNKGMALFPRKIDGKYVMCSRIDGENLFIMKSDDVHFWEEATKLIPPKYAWELMQIGNCGAPIETPEGWLLLTHGVGPLRTYAIGAMLLDLEDPTKIIGHLKQPLIAPAGTDREGYVPNVVYTCGAMAHHGELFIPFASADKTTSVVAVGLNDLVTELKRS